MTAKAKKGFNGWKASETVKASGYDWKISTSKRNSGYLTASAQAGETKEHEGYSTFSFTMFQDPNIQLKSIKSRCTEKAVNELHLEALTIFERMKEAGELPENTCVNKNETAADKYEVKKGQIVYFDDIHYSPIKQIVINKVVDKYNTYFELLNPESMEFSTSQRIRPFSEKFGIGTYYNEGEIFENMEELDNLIIEAKKMQQKEQADREARSILAKAERAAKIEQGKKLVTIPENAKSIIVAELRVDDSDVQTDYFAAHTEEVFYLAYSSHTRDIFSEMRKAAANATQPEIQAFKDVNFGRENRQKYSMGRGYFLSEGYSRSGIEISKNRFSYRDEGISEELKDNLYVAAAEGRYFCEAAKADPNSIEVVKASIISSGVQVAKYSERAGIVYGDTKPIKDTLKSLGCRFNPRLKVDGVQVMGWVFKLDRLDEIKAAVLEHESA